MGKVHSPNSLVAYAVREAAKVYRFSPQDALSYVRNIDYYSVPASGHAHLEFGIICNRHLEDEKRKRLFSSVRRFLLKRRRLMDVICNMLAKMIVNFETIEEIEDANMRRVRAKYVKYSDIVSQLAEVDVRVRLEDNLQKLIGHIQEERSRVKLINLFVSQSKLSSGTHSCDYEPYVEACFGDGSFSEIPKLGESNDGPVQQKSFEWELKESVGEMGSEGGINGGERDQNQNQKKVDDCDTGEGLGDDSLVLYGMIRCS